MTHYFPEGFHTVTPFVIVRGAGSLVEFLQKTVDAKITRSLYHNDGSLWHAQLKIGNSMVMVADAGDMPPTPATLYLYLPDCDSVYARALENGATSIQEPQDKFYGDRVSAVRDYYGNSWWFATHKEDMNEEELQRRAALFEEAQRVKA